MKLILLVIIVLIVFFILYMHNDDMSTKTTLQTHKYYKPQDTEVIRDLTVKGALIMNASQIHQELPVKDFVVHGHSWEELTHTYTLGRKEIFLVIKQGLDNYYSNDTLTHIFLHEFAHILDESGNPESHSENFKLILKEVRDRAMSLGLIDGPQEIDKSYPCQQEIHL